MHQTRASIVIEQTDQLTVVWHIVTARSARVGWCTGAAYVFRDTASRAALPRARKRLVNVKALSLTCAVAHSDAKCVVRYRTHGFARHALCVSSYDTRTHHASHHGTNASFTTCCTPLIYCKSVRAYRIAIGTGTLAG